MAALANPRRKIERIVATRNAASRLPEGIDPQILDPDAIDGMFARALKVSELRLFALDPLLHSDWRSFLLQSSIVGTKLTL